MKKHKHRYVAVVEKHAVNGTNTITLMKPNHRYVALAKSTDMDGVNPVVYMFSHSCLVLQWVPSKSIDKMHGLSFKLWRTRGNFAEDLSWA